MLFEHRVLFIVPFELGVASIGKQKFLFRLTPRRVESWYHTNITATYSLITSQSQIQSSLLDTYDPRQAIHTAIEVARRAQETRGHTLAAVRWDSGDIRA